LRGSEKTEGGGGKGGGLLSSKGTQYVGGKVDAVLRGDAGGQGLLV